MSRIPGYFGGDFLPTTVIIEERSFFFINIAFARARGGMPTGALEQRLWPLILNGELDLADPRFNLVIGDLLLIGPLPYRFLETPQHFTRLDRGESDRPLCTLVQLEAEQAVDL